MKIDEAVKIINGTTTTRAEFGDANLFVFEKNAGEGEWFLSVCINSVDWHSVSKDWSCLDNVKSQDLARVMDVIQRLLDTPVKERFPEKKYRLRWIDDEDGSSNYIAIENGTHWVWQCCGRDTFTESELEQLKRDNPRLAPAIDAMKEEVKDDEN